MVTRIGTPELNFGANLALVGKELGDNPERLVTDLRRVGFNTSVEALKAAEEATVQLDPDMVAGVAHLLCMKPSEVMVHPHLFQKTARPFMRDFLLREAVERHAWHIEFINSYFSDLPPVPVPVPAGA